mmetsp:Transcript_36760/g.115117  ORF Transcript_36760/g.115117 Transcript_36760/m.115117 type:complete len:448 (+) Transcript_36760:2677-4020(+)
MVPALVRAVPPAEGHAPALRRHGAPAGADPRRDGILAEPARPAGGAALPEHARWHGRRPTPRRILAGVLARAVHASAHGHWRQRARDGEAGRQGAGCHRAGPHGLANGCRAGRRRATLGRAERATRRASAADECPPGHDRRDGAPAPDDHGVADIAPGAVSLRAGAVGRGKASRLCGVGDVGGCASGGPLCAAAGLPRLERPSQRRRALAERRGPARHGTATAPGTEVAPPQPPPALEHRPERAHLAAALVHVAAAVVADAGGVDPARLERGGLGAGCHGEPGPAAAASPRQRVVVHDAHGRLLHPVHEPATVDDGPGPGLQHGRRHVEPGRDPRSGTGFHRQRHAALGQLLLLDGAGAEGAGGGAGAPGPAEPAAPRQPGALALRAPIAHVVAPQRRRRQRPDATIGPRAQRAASPRAAAGPTPRRRVDPRGSREHAVPSRSRRAG